MNCVHGRTIYTGKRVVKDAYVAFAGGRISGISRSRRGTLVGKFPVITPAFIDAHSHIGLVPAGEPSNDGEVNERLELVMPVPDALDSVMMDDTSFVDSIESGVLYSCVMPGSGNIIGGKSAVIRNYARNTTEALIGRAGIKGAFGYNPVGDKTKPGQRPLTRMGSMSVLRQKFHDVRQKMQRRRGARGKKKDEVTFSAGEEALRQVLERTETLRIHVHKADDIAALLRLVGEFKLRLIVEHTCDVHDPHTFEELKKRKIPVVYGPLDAFAYKVELKHETWRNIRHLIASGVEYGLMSDHPVTLQTTLFLGLRRFIRCGLTKQQALEIITRKNAKILGLDKVLGTIERGKWASFVCFNGDPFDMTRHPVAVYGEGERLYSE